MITGVTVNAAAACQRSRRVSERRPQPQNSASVSGITDSGTTVVHFVAKAAPAATPDR